MHVPSFCWNWYWNINHVSLEIGQVRYNKTRVIASQTNFSGTISSLLHISLRFIELFHVFRNKQKSQEDYCLARTARFSQFSGKRLLIQVWWLDSISRVAGHEFPGRDSTEVSVFTIFLTLVWVENVRGHLQAPSCQTLKWIASYFSILWEELVFARIYPPLECLLLNTILKSLAPHHHTTSVPTTHYKQVLCLYSPNLHDWCQQRSFYQTKILT